MIQERGGVDETIKKAVTGTNRLHIQKKFGGMAAVRLKTGNAACALQIISADVSGEKRRGRKMFRRVARQIPVDREVGHCSGVGEKSALVHDRSE